MALKFNKEFYLMPNPSVRAAAEGLPTLNRRALLGYFAAIPAAMAIPALAVASAPKSVPDVEHFSVALPVSIDERLALLPPDVAKRLRIKFNAMIDQAWAEIHREHERERRRDRLAARRKGMLS
ncbi:hypothetical protein NKI79_21355 [Mesorhizobium sp. M0340]|uniref:hypothetical protein n=1 Tax=Mesorhizobium sp. M0340 TaxID=2956939 RepID=UPI0033383561